MGLPPNTIRRRVAEISGFLGIQSWFGRSTHELSGGQKQMLSLAGVLVMQPKALILDEPTSQLDPIAATEFFETIKKKIRSLQLPL
jgi:energy-coupling factor transport system ATP-binding protein